MDSRLLASLNEQASSTRDPVLWARTVCRAASHFARHGNTSQALTSIAVVRSQFSDQLHPEVASWLMLAEGVLNYFQKKPREAYDRIRRAHGLAVALNTESALPSCAAWMAHMEFNECQYEQMAVHLEQALLSAKPDDHQALARASLVMADAYQLVGEFDLARPWYERTRQSAAAEGDEATVSAMLYNVAAFRAANVRLADTFGLEITADFRRASIEASSATTFDVAIGSSGLDFLTKMLWGLILTIEKKYLEASSVLESINTESIHKRMIPLIQVDVSWCSANLGYLEDAWVLAKLASAQLPICGEADDVAYINSRLSQIADLCGRPDDVETYRKPAIAALAEHRKFQAKLLSRLMSIKTC